MICSHEILEDEMGNFKTTILTITIGIIFAAPTRAQWVSVGLDSLDVGRLYVHGDTMVVAAVKDTSITNLNTIGARIKFSDNSGKTWEDRTFKISTDSTYIGALIVSSTDISIWYILLYGIPYYHALYKTTDAGKTWLLQNDSIVDMTMISWANQNEIYGVNVINNSEIINKSDDGGTTWDVIYTAPSTNSTISLAQDQVDSSTLYWFMEFTYNGSNFEGFFMSTDKGETRTEKLPPGAGYEGALYANPRIAGDIYFIRNGTGPSTSALWHSSDFGDTWDTATGVAIANLKNKNNKFAAPLYDFIISGGEPGFAICSVRYRCNR
ncbi:MAG TPA: sialidase family protein [Candidatus Kapabacteria bacterium]|nr:sialidase family protein [Candidatus Kapabacteria bacterium]